MSDERHRFTSAPGCRPPAGRRLGALPVLAAVLLAAAGCSTYHPIGRGSTVPWAEELGSGKRGPIGEGRYRVGQGDMLGLIAERYDIDLASLAAANNIEPPYVLYVGEVLRIPSAAAPVPERRPAGSTIVETALPAVEAPAPAAQPARATASLTENPSTPEGRPYVVAVGESLSLIAARNGLRLGELVAANAIEPPYRIRPGQHLIIPPTEAGRHEHADEAERPSAALATAAAAPPPLNPEGFMWPVHGQVISNFDENAAKGLSGGVTIAARRGTPVRAAEDGIVAYAGEALRGYGQMIMLRHDKGYVTLYAHNNALLVREGDLVLRGQTIAEVGSSGDVLDSQLHFELRQGAQPVDPTKVLAGLPGPAIGGL